VRDDTAMASPTPVFTSESPKSLVFHSALTDWVRVVVPVIVWTSFSPAVIAPECLTSNPGFFSHTPPAPRSTSSLDVIVPSTL
jgi:hypothetical protein